jgi:hypothetical protein
MNNKNEFDLLSEIAKLVKKYGPETFERLAAQVSRPEFHQQLADILSATAKVSRSSQSDKDISKAKESLQTFRTTLVELEKMQPDKGSILLQLYDGLITKMFLPTVRDIQAFVTDNGLPPLKATSRDKAIVPFIKVFLSMPSEEVKEYLKRIQPSADTDDRSLAGWSNIIFGKEGRAKNTTEGKDP